MKTPLPLLLAAASACVAGLAMPAHGALAGQASTLLTPSTVFAQAGAAEDVRSYVVGATWNWSWRRDLGAGALSGYFEASVGRWIGEGDSSGASAWVTQIGITPVLRFHFNRSERTWFLEAGIGANVLTPLYRSSDKRFSTAFNFGDHLGVGRRFGAKGSYEISLRYEHFSNGGIKRPNPGEDFVQLRFGYRLRASAP
jgi:hypothetical protein